MSEPVREVMQGWGMNRVTDPVLEASPGESYRVKVFKSGNSLALRLPAGLKLAAGIEMKLCVKDGYYTVEPVDRPKRKFDIDKVWGIGKHLELKPFAPEDRVFEHRPLLWDDPDWLASLDNHRE